MSAFPDVFLIMSVSIIFFLSFSCTLLHYKGLLKISLSDQETVHILGSGSGHELFSTPLCLHKWIEKSCFSIFPLMYFLQLHFFCNLLIITEIT